MTSKPKSVISAAAGCALLIATSSVAWADSLPSRQYLPLKSAQKIARKALKECQKGGFSVTVAVVDRSGEMKVQLRDDGAGPHTVGSSYGKAFASASLRNSTSFFANLIANNPVNDGLRDMDDRLVLQAGGLPISVNGDVVGGIGVGGAPAGSLDEACAQAGLNALHD